MITPVRNGGQYIKNAIISVDNQEYLCEHIVVDDCSEDNTWDILVQMSKDRPWLKIFKLPRREGSVKARNYAISNSKGKYLAFLDADDVWAQNKLKTQIPFMKENGAFFTFTDYYCLSHDQKKIGRRVSGLNEITWFLHHTTRFIACSSVVIDHVYFKDLVFRDVSPANRAEDFLLWSDCLLKVKSAVRCPHALLYYTIMKSSRSSAKLSGLKSIFLVLYKCESNTLLASIFYLVFSTVFAAVKHVWQIPNKRFDLRKKLNMASI